MRPANVAAAVLVASDQLNLSQACRQCGIPDGSRSRVGKLAIEIGYVVVDFENGMPEVPEVWKPSSSTEALVKASAKPKRKLEAVMARPEEAKFIAEHFKRESTQDLMMRSPGKTRCIHVLKYYTPSGGCEISTYAADLTPAGEVHDVRQRRRGTNRERRSQARKALQYRVFARKHPEGVKAMQREQIAGLPRERAEWLSKELKICPRLLDYNPGLLDYLTDSELAPGMHREDGQWDPLLKFSYDHSMESFAQGKWRWFNGMDPVRAREGKLQTVCVDTHISQKDDKMALERVAAFLPKEYVDACPSTLSEDEEEEWE